MTNDLIESFLHYGSVNRFVLEALWRYSRGTSGISDNVSISFLESKLSYNAVMCVFSDETEPEEPDDQLTRYGHPYKSLNNPSQSLGTPLTAAMNCE